MVLYLIKSAIFRHLIHQVYTYQDPVLRIWDVYPGSEFFLSRIRNKEFKYFNPKKMVSKPSEIWSGLFIPDPDPDFLTIPDPGSWGVKKGPDSGSVTLPSPSAHTCCTPTRTMWVWGWPATTMSSTPTLMTARSSALPFTKRQAAVFYLRILCTIQFTYRCWFLNFSPQSAV